jgi:hypothetical protein
MLDHPSSESGIPASAQRAGRKQPRVEAAGRYPGKVRHAGLRPEGPRESGRSINNSALAALQAAWRLGLLTQGISLWLLPWGASAYPGGDEPRPYTSLGLRRADRSKGIRTIPGPIPGLRSGSKEPGTHPKRSDPIEEAWTAAKELGSDLRGLDRS